MLTAYTHTHTHRQTLNKNDDDEVETEADNVCVLCFFFLETSSADAILFSISIITFHPVYSTYCTPCTIHYNNSNLSIHLAMNVDL